ncbi:hypothetical protein [Corynebacterium mayonis]|uniref:hypothetical protein n=1 Tax=Corynebacterium mayonis TaxID=3062461 RepID=UPI003140B488
MKLFLSPNKYILPVAGIFALAICIALGRFIAGSGTTWTLLGAIFLGKTTATLASNWTALNQLGASFRKFLSSGVIFSALSALALTAAAVTAGQISWSRNPHYTFYDVLLITTGPTPFTDTNGEPYLVEYAGQTPATIAASIALTLLVFTTAGITGIMTGLSRNNGQSLTIFIGISLIILFLSDTVATTTVLTVASVILLAISSWMISRTPRFTP